MELKKGYKQTEVGVIPEDWNVKPLGDIFSFSGGFSASRDQLSSEGYCYLHYGDIHKSAKTFIDVQTEYQDIPKLDISLKRVSAASLLSDGDVVFVDASEDDEGASKHIVIINKERIAFISGLHTIVTKSKTALLDNQYKRYCFQSRDIKRQFYYYAVGTKVTGISKTNISKIFLPVPSLPEQTAIATALSDVDALIASLDKLTTKKRDIKQGTMQQLITGKKRLPGFSDKWDLKSFDECFTFLSSGSNSRSELSESGDVKYIHYGDIHTKWNLVLDCEKDSIPAINKNSVKNLPFLQEGDLVIADASEDYEGVGISVEVRNVKHLKLVAGLHTLLLRSNEGVFANGFKAYITSIPKVRKSLQRLATGLKVFGISKTNLKLIQIPIPPTIEEQTAIAQVLSDMDAEIEALEQKRDKYKAIKQGIMQELLTGKTRLI